MNITTNSLIIIGTRFFYATHFKDDGDAQWYVCVGKNGYHYNKKDNMTPLIEAFCFMSIMTNMKEKEYKVFSEFKKNINKLEQQKTDKEGEDKLDYYREKMYVMMEESKKLKTLLMDTYNEKKEILNFELIKNKKL